MPPGFDELDIALSSLIENGFIVEELVRREAEKVNQQLIATQSIDAFSEAWGLFYSFHNSEEEVVRKFENNILIPVTNLLAFINNFSHL